MASRMVSSGSNALASSIVLVCHKRHSDAPSISRRDFIRELNQVLPEALDEMTRGTGDGPSLIAPRRAIWETGSSDKIIVQPWADEAFAQIERAYWALAVPNYLVRDRFEGGYQWHGELAYRIFDQELRPQ